MIREHLISLVEIIHSVNDLEVGITEYIKKQTRTASLFCVVELELTGPTSTSQNIRTTRSESLALFWSSGSALSVRSRILSFPSMLG